MPERLCDTCKHYRPYEGRLRETYAKCSSPRKPAVIEFAETLRGVPDLCGPDARWWERKPPIYEPADETLHFDEDEGDPSDEE